MNRHTIRRFWGEILCSQTLETLEWERPANPIQDAINQHDFSKRCLNILCFSPWLPPPPTHFPHKLIWHTIQNDGKSRKSTHTTEVSCQIFPKTPAGWWLGTWILWFSIQLGMESSSQLTFELIFFRGVGVPTTKQPAFEAFYTPAASEAAPRSAAFCRWHGAYSAWGGAWTAASWGLWEEPEPWWRWIWWIEWCCWSRWIGKFQMKIWSNLARKLLGIEWMAKFSSLNIKKVWISEEFPVEPPTRIRCHFAKAASGWFPPRLRVFDAHPRG